MDAAHPKHVITKLPENGLRTSGRDHPVCVMPHPPPCICVCHRDRSLQPLYLSTLFNNLFVHTFTNLGTMWPSCPAISEVLHLRIPCVHLHHPSIGDPGSCQVRHLGEWPSAVVSESDHGLSKARCSSSSMATPQSHNHHRLLGSGFPSSSPCSSSASVDGCLGSTSSRSSSSSCSLSSSSDVEESAGQFTNRQAPNYTIRATSWETRGM